MSLDRFFELILREECPIVRSAGAEAGGAATGSRASDDRRRFTILLLGPT